MQDLKIRIFADGADLDAMLALAENPLVRGFTTNPTLMKQAGITDYRAFASQVLEALPDYPVSLEVFADDFEAMIAQGREIASWGRNVNVKIPVTDTGGVFAGPVIGALSHEGIVVNVTAVMTVAQVEQIVRVLSPEVPAIVSVFAGRIADTGVDPVPHMRNCRAAMAACPKAELLWASPRELLNVFHAEQAGCHIITATGDVLAKLRLVGRDLTEYSRETVQMFRKDALAAGFRIETARG